MSFRAAMVITSLLAVIPEIGADLIFLLWGGYSIHDATLHRFYSLHFTFPFLILIISIIHLFLLHEFGSNNPLGLNSNID
jgi:ubiquinol-cytochrome c reductase cytochrome b subunit